MPPRFLSFPTILLLALASPLTVAPARAAELGSSVQAESLGAESASTERGKTERGKTEPETEQASAPSPQRPQAKQAPATKASGAEPAKSDPEPALPADTSASIDEDDERARDDERKARDAYARGDRLYFEGDYQGALEAFEESYALSGRIEMLFNLANAHERLGSYAQAAVALRGYIPHAASASRPALQKRAERLEKLGQAQTSAAAPPPTQGEDQPSIPIARAIGIGLTGLGIIGLGLGTGFGIAALDQRSKLDDLCETGKNGRLCPPEASPILEKDATFSTVADISFVLGGVATAAGVYLIIDSRPNGREVSAHLGPSSLWLKGRF